MLKGGGATITTTKIRTKAGRFISSQVHLPFCAKQQAKKQHNNDAKYNQKHSGRSTLLHIVALKRNSGKKQENSLVVSTEDKIYGGTTITTIKTSTLRQRKGRSSITFACQAGGWWWRWSQWWGLPGWGGSQLWGWWWGGGSSMTMTTRT